MEIVASDAHFLLRHCGHVLRSNTGDHATCVGLQCAAGPPLGTVLGQASCAEAAPDGYVLNPELGVCEAP